MSKLELNYQDLLNRVRSVTKTKQDNDVTNLKVQSTTKLKLKCRDLSDRVRFVMKTRQYNDVTDHTGAVYDENDIELS